MGTDGRTCVNICSDHYQPGLCSAEWIKKWAFKSSYSKHFYSNVKLPCLTSICFLMSLQLTHEMEILVHIWYACDMICIYVKSNFKGFLLCTLFPILCKIFPVLIFPNWENEINWIQSSKFKRKIANFLVYTKTKSQTVWLGQGEGCISC